MEPRFAPASERVLGPAEYLLGALELGVVVAALAFAAVRLRRALLPGWAGPPALVADCVLALALATVAGVALGTFGAFTALGYLLAALALAAGAALLPGALASGTRLPAPPVRPGPRGGVWVAALVCAAIFATWAIPTLTGVAGGMNRADSLWYHMPLSARFMQTGETGSLDFFDPIFFAHFYPAGSELLHAVPLLAFERDFLSPLLNLGFLALGLLAGWAIGRPYGVAAASLAGAGVVLGAGTMVNFQGGEALNDIVGVALLLCAVALLVNGWAAVRAAREQSAPAGGRASPGAASWPPGAYLVAGAAAGLAVGVKLSFVAPVAVLSAGALVLVPRAALPRAAAAWSLPLLVAGGYWYARNLVAVGNPIPFTRFGPLGLPAPERAFQLRPGNSVAHYWDQPSVWADSFAPALAEQLGWLWPLTLAATLAGAVYLLWRVRDPILRVLGVVALLTAVAYVFTPLTAGGEEGDPIAFEWNIRYLAPAIAIALAALPCAPALRASAGRRALTLAALALLALVATLTVDQWPNGGHTRGALATGALVAAAFAAGGWARSRGWIGPAASRPRLVALAAAGLALALAAGYALERHSLERRYQNLSPQFHIAEAVRWAQDLRGARIAVSGVRGVFHQYAFYGVALQNRVQWLGLEGEHGAFLRIGDCETWRRELNAGGYDYVVTMYDPYDPASGDLTDTKEALWTRSDPHAVEVVRDGPVAVFEIVAPLDPAGCAGLPDLSPAELNGDSVNLEPGANQPPPGAGRSSAGGPDGAGTGDAGPRGDGPAAGTES